MYQAWRATGSVKAFVEKHWVCRGEGNVSGKVNTCAAVRVAGDSLTDCGIVKASCLV